MNSHTVYESNKLSSLYSENKIDENVTNVSEMEDNVLQDGVDIGDIFTASKILQYENMECNNY